MEFRITTKIRSADIRVQTDKIRSGKYTKSCRKQGKFTRRYIYTLAISVKTIRDAHENRRKENVRRSN